MAPLAEAVAAESSVVEVPCPPVEDVGAELLLPPPDSEGEGEVGEPAEGGKARTRHLRRAQRRADRAKVRDAHDKSRTRELRALLDVLDSLPNAVPALPARLAPAQGASAADVAAAARGSPGARAPLADEGQVEEAVAAAEAVMRVGVRPYSELPEAFGPEGGIAVLAAMIDRPPKYQEKYLAQELSLLAKVWALVEGVGPASGGADGADPSAPGRRRRVAVVDVGAGNGCLALLAAVLLDGYAVLIDHTLPPKELRVEDKVPEPYRSRVLRINGDVADLDVWQHVVPLLKQHGAEQAVVVAKHLCGVGTDLTLGLVQRWCSGPTDGAACDQSSVALVGAVFATCCGHKIGAGDRESFAALHAGDAYLDRLTVGDPGRILQLLALCTRCVAWRTTAGALGSRITVAQVRAAELFEDVLQQPRLNALRRLFPAVAEVLFVPRERSPQNRCLLAGSAEALRLAGCGGAEEGAFLRALEAARDRLLAANGGAPLDLKPHGFVSSKYDYDGA